MMRSFPWRAGMLFAPIVLAGGLGSQGPAHALPARPLRDNLPSQAATAPSSPLTQEALLKKLEGNIAGALRREHLPLNPFHDEQSVRAATYHARARKLYLPARNGKGHLVEMVVPAADGLHLDLQLLEGKYVTAAVRPSRLSRQYRTEAGTFVQWTSHLDSFWLDTANVTLLVNLDYGQKVKQEVVSRIADIVAASVKEINGSVNNPQAP